MYPNEKDHMFLFGDLTESLLTKSYNNPYMRDIHSEATPFIINGDSIIYDGKFQNPEEFKPSQIIIDEINNHKQLEKYQSPEGSK